MAHNLLTTAQPWEGNVIENPSMVTYGSKTYLFYSANRYRDRCSPAAGGSTARAGRMPSWVSS